MEGLLDPRTWAERHFGNAQLNDSRRTQRLVFSAGKIAAYPEKSFTQVFDWNDLRAFYGLCNRPEATLSSVQQTHWQLTRQAMAQYPLVLLLHDTTELDFTTHQALKGTGPLGDGGGRGFLQHNSLAVVPQPRQVLGLAYQQWRVRQPAPPGESSYQCRRRKNRESCLWWQGIEAIGPPAAASTAAASTAAASTAAASTAAASTAAGNPACCLVDVVDCGGDIYESMHASRTMQHHFLFRAGKNRTVWLTEDGRHRALLRDFARTLPSQGTDQVDIAGRGGRPARTATVCLAAAPIWIPAPRELPRHQDYPVYKVWLIRVWEAHPPAEIEEPMEWLLLCSLPTQTLAELKERRDWYACRWLAEVYHDVEKNGCSEEDRRFETAQGMEAALAVLSVVAVRILQLRMALDSQPEQPAEQVGTAQEIRLVRRFVKHKGRSFTVKDFVSGIAKLGGYLGRKKDGPPGVRSLWRGYQRLQDMLLGQQLSSPLPNDASGP